MDGPTLTEWIRRVKQQEAAVELIYLEGQLNSDDIHRATLAMEASYELAKWLERHNLDGR